MQTKALEHPPLAILVTGGAGFIGANFLHYWSDKYPQDKLINLDALTYAGNLASLTTLEKNPNYLFVNGDIRSAQLVDQLMSKTDVVVHFAAESHVDRSIKSPDVFLETNVLGTHTLLKFAVKHSVKRFHHISTDEVFGSLELGSKAQFDERTSYSPNSIYSASKAGSDFLVRAYGETYGLNYSITNCSNNYGPYQFPEKLIPLAITNLMETKKVPVYGDGLQVRDWLYVLDHCRAIELVLLSEKARGQTYLVGGLTEDINNLQVVKMILRLMGKDQAQIKMVDDRAGHDRRYSVNWQKIERELGWQPSVDFESGLKATIDWYQTNSGWWQPLKAKEHNYFREQYHE